MTTHQNKIRNDIFNSGYQPKVGDLIDIAFKLTLFGWSSEKNSLDLSRVYSCPIKLRQVGSLILVQEQPVSTDMLFPAHREPTMSVSNIINAACRTKNFVWQIFDDSQNLVHSELMTYGHVKGFLALGDNHLLWISTTDLKTIEYYNKNDLASKVID